MKKKHLLPIIALLIVAGWAVRFYFVNTNFGGAKLRYFETGEKVPYEKDYFYLDDEIIEGYSILVKGATLYSIHDYLALYDIDYASVQSMNPTGYVPDYIYAVDVVFENEGNTNINTGLNMFATLLINADLRLMINANIWTLQYPHLEGSLTFKLRTDTTQELQLPYAVETAREQADIDLELLEKRLFLLNITQYPTRKMIVVDRYETKP